MIEIIGNIFTVLAVIISAGMVVLAVSQIFDWVSATDSRIERLEQRCDDQYAEIIKLRAEVGDR